VCISDGRAVIHRISLIIFKIFNKIKLTETSHLLIGGFTEKNGNDPKNTVPTYKLIQLFTHNIKQFARKTVDMVRLSRLNNRRKSVKFFYLTPVHRTIFFFFVEIMTVLKSTNK
jgi:hypothetical protein